MRGPFENRVALVTGGSRGIGRATALKLAAEGADVAVGYVSGHDSAEQVVEEIKGTGRNAFCGPCNVANQQQIDQFVQQTRQKLGPIDLLAHCGAISNVADHTQMTFELWQETIDINLHGAFRVVFAVKDEMIERGFGRMVLISSVAALRPRGMQIHYASAKAGVIAMVRCCSDAFVPHNVRVNCIAPGLIDTDMAYTLSPEWIEKIKKETPMGRLGRPEEIADVACFLLSEKSSFMSGQTIVASGGRVTVP